MSLRNFYLLVAACGMLWGCKNEPYATPPLGIVSLVNHETEVTSTYRYRDQRIYTYTVGTSITKFYYNNNLVDYLMGDSTPVQHKITRFYPAPDLSTLDSTFLVVVDTVKDVITSVTPIATRTIQYDGNLRRPVKVYQKSWGATMLTNHTAELTWDEAGNVSRFVYTDHLDAKKSLSHTITYDDQLSIFTPGPDYVFTVSLPDLYRLSANNALSFYDGSTEKLYKYWYNKLGYPSNFQSDANVVFGVSYTQMR